MQTPIARATQVILAVMFVAPLTAMAQETAGNTRGNIPHNVV